MRRVVVVGRVALGLLSGAKGLTSKSTCCTQVIRCLHLKFNRQAFGQKPSNTLSINQPGMNNPTHVGDNLRLLIAEAYRAIGPNPRVFATPDWADKSVYRIEAKIPDDVFAAMQKMTQEERAKKQALMLQRLLAERFNLREHFERREMPVYDLVAIAEEQRNYRGQR